MNLCYFLAPWCNLLSANHNNNTPRGSEHIFYIQLRAIAHLLGVCFMQHVYCTETQHGCVHGNFIYECTKISRSLPSLFCFADNNQKSPYYILLSLFTLHSSLFTLHSWSLIFFTFDLQSSLLFLTPYPLLLTLHPLQSAGGSSQKDLEKRMRSSDNSNRLARSGYPRCSKWFVR